MPFVFFFVAVMLIVIGIRGTQSQAIALIKSEMTGDGQFSHSYLPWLIAVGVIGGLGYIPQIKKEADAFLWLCILAFVLANGKNGLFASFQSQVSNAAASGANTAGSMTPSDGNTATGAAGYSPSSIAPVQGVPDPWAGAGTSIMSQTATPQTAASIIGQSSINGQNTFAPYIPDLFTPAYGEDTGTVGYGVTANPWAS